MSNASKTSPSARHRLGHSWVEMSAIREAGCNLVHWPRPSDAATVRFLHSLSQRSPQPAPLQESLLATQVAERLADHLSPFCRGHEDGFDHLCTDVGQLATSFAALASSPRLRVFFGLVQHDMCRLFHTDAIELRLLCTYQGSGTMWVPDQYVNWEAMHERSNEARVRDLSQVQQCAPFEVAILKGAMYEPNDGPAVLHRSPTVAEAGSTRVLLRLDSQLAW
jgi:hypothetical protein